VYNGCTRCRRFAPNRGFAHGPQPREPAKLLILGILRWEKVQRNGAEIRWLEGRAGQVIRASADTISVSFASAQRDYRSL
jgi:hypothetical protein